MPFYKIYYLNIMGNCVIISRNNFHNMLGKGRMKGADTVTVSRNEILMVLNKPDEYILAIVEVDGTNTHTVYLKSPFLERPDFAATSVNYDIGDLVRGADRIEVLR